MICPPCTLLRAAPFQGSESSNFLVELSPNECESVSNPIAFLVELLGTKIMFAGSVQQLHLFDFWEKIDESEFFVGLANNLRIVEKLVIGSETLGNGLSEKLINLCFQLGQLSSQVNIFLFL